MESLGFFELEVPSTGARVIGEKINAEGGTFYKFGGNTYRVHDLTEIGEAPEGRLPAETNLPWNKA